VVGMVTRMTGRKASTCSRPLDAVMRLICSSSCWRVATRCSRNFQNAESRYPGKLRAIIEFNNTMAHRIQAGSDAFLMPSRFEPCGLTQMYALRYGTHRGARTGGLRDTVAEFDPARGSGNGFVFENFEAAEMVAALGRMVAMFRDRATWRR